MTDYDALFAAERARRQAINPKLNVRFIRSDGREDSYSFADVARADAFRAQLRRSGLRLLDGKGVRPMTTETLQRATNHPAFDKPEIVERARFLVEAIAEGMADNDEAVYESDPCERIDPIEFEARDGFFPWTAGGFEVCLAAELAHHWSTGTAPAPIRPLIERGNEFIADAWAERFPDRPPLVDCILAGAAFREEAREFESEAWAADNDVYFWKARVMFLAPGDRQNETGEPEIYVDAYLNTDLNYGRDSVSAYSVTGRRVDRTHGEFKRTIPLATFSAMTDDELSALADEAVRSLP